jgi:small subunit ribosomal protein S11
MAKSPKEEPVKEKEAVITEEAATNDAPATEAVAEAPTADAAADTPAEGAEAAPKVRKKKNRRTVTSGQIHVLATFNNTAYAAQIAAEKAISTARQNFGLTKAEVFVKGVGMGRDAAIRTLSSQKVQLDNIKDVTGIPHGGVRPRKPKRN